MLCNFDDDFSLEGFLFGNEFLMRLGDPPVAFAWLVGEYERYVLSGRDLHRLVAAGAGHRTSPLTVDEVGILPLLICLRFSGSLALLQSTIATALSFAQPNNEQTDRQYGGRCAWLQAHHT